MPPPLAGAAVAEEEPGTWLADKQRTDVKTGYFSKAELQAIREGVEVPPPPFCSPCGGSNNREW